jgi:transposase-like protein
MKEIYTAPNREAALQALKDLKTNWGEKYGYAIKSWKEGV